MSIQQVSRFMFSMLLILQFLVLGTPIDAISACVPPPAGMVSWWPGDGDASDISGGNNGTLMSSVSFATGEVGQAFRLNGGFVEVPDAPSLNITGQITIDAWINPSELGGRVVDKMTAGGSDGYLLDTYGGVVRFIVGGTVLSGSTFLPTGTWSHIAGVYDGSQMIVYVNGVQDGSVAVSGLIPVNALPLRIGADSAQASLFDGRIDEVELFNTALSAAELQAIVGARSDGKCKPSSVPALTEWGIIILAVSAGLLSAFCLRKRTA